MALTPQTLAHQGDGVRKGRGRVARPCCRTPGHRGCADQRGRYQCYRRIPSQQGWRGASRGLITPLALSFDSKVCPPLFNRGFHLPAADERGQDLDWPQLRVRRQQCLRCTAPFGIAYQHPSTRDDRLTRVGPDGRFGSDLDTPRSLALPGCHGDRAPARRRSGPDFRKRWQPLALPARTSVLPRVTRRGRLIERRIEAQTGDHTHGVAARIKPLQRRIGVITHHDQVSLRPPASHQPHGVPCAVQQRSGGTAALLLIALRGRQHRQEWHPPDPRGPRDRRQEHQAHPAPPRGVHEVRRRGLYRVSRNPLRGTPLSPSPFNRQYQGLWCSISPRSFIEGGRCLCQAMRKSPSVPGVYDR
jgi:hypothetical protein